MSTLYMLWDESHIWGLLLWRALVALGLPFEMLRAEEIAHGALSRKSPALLLVPGGVARRKSLALGAEGMRAIREFVHGGGSYMGFCGGSGLGLTGEYGLGLCPWSRAPIRDRLLHLVSGHMHMETPQDEEFVPDYAGSGSSGLPLIPVWWPARFEPGEQEQVHVLARYAHPGPDFWLSDLPMNSLPDSTIPEWEERFGIRFRPALSGQPCMIRGDFGNGSYLLSYAHLETPNSPDANRWLAHLVGRFTGLPTPDSFLIPPWRLEDLGVEWLDPVLLELRELLQDLMRLGQEHMLLFSRNCWLTGWRSGIPGSNLNHLYSLALQVMNTTPGEQAQHYLERHGQALSVLARRFHHEARSYLLAERLATTLSGSVPPETLHDMRNELFGSPMEQGGLYGDLLQMLDSLAWLVLRHARQLPDSGPAESHCHSL